MDVRQCEERAVCKRKAIESSFSTDRLQRAISVPPVGITLSLFTSMMLERSKKKEGKSEVGKAEGGKGGVISLSDNLRKIRIQGKRAVGMKSIRVHCDTCSRLEFLLFCIVIDEEILLCHFSFGGHFLERLQNGASASAESKFHCNEMK